mgnify:CR=1 FL=1
MHALQENHRPVFADGGVLLVCVERVEDDGLVGQPGEVGVLHVVVVVVRLDHAVLGMHLAERRHHVIAILHRGVVLVLLLVVAGRGVIILMSLAGRRRRVAVWIVVNTAVHAAMHVRLLTMHLVAKTRRVGAGGVHGGVQTMELFRARGLGGAELTRLGG